MLKGINPILSPDLLATLRAMGHGDEIAIVDGNYPALEHGRRLIRLDGMNLGSVIDAVLSVLPVDDFIEDALFRSTAGADASALHAIHHEMLKICKQHAPDKSVIPLVGEAFYNRVKNCHAIVSTSEPSLYANLIIRKGVIHPIGEK
ncbi:MAG: RbsD/FucU domain-containing protein [Salaquimonas sp.]